MENKIIEMLEQMNTRFDARFDKIENDINNLTIDIKDIKTRIIKTEEGISDTALVVNHINTKLEHSKIDKLALLTLEETAAKLKKENFIIKEHMGLE